MLRLIASLIIIVAGFAAPLNAEDAKDKAPAKAPDKPVADKPAFHLSPMILKSTDAVEHFIYGEMETDQAGMMDALQKTFFPLMEKEGKDGLILDAPPTFVYQGATQDPKQKFKLATGFPTREGAKAAGEFKVKKLDGIRCASIYFTGSLEHFGKAYESIFTQLIKAGHKPTGETRELYLFWAGEASPNTVVEIQVAIAPQEKK